MKEQYDLDNLPENFSEEIHKRIGHNVAKIRKEKKVSQLKLANAIGYKSVSPVSSGEIYYRGIHFNVEQLVKISIALDVDISEFFK
jgi:transcriptional regulator with XRE-family HTH domain